MANIPSFATKGPAIALAILMLLAGLPACAQEDGQDDQIVGPPPKLDCCWGYAPAPKSDWLKPARQG
jgi:hypothetical protein